MSGVDHGLTTDELRAAVRAVLHDVLPATGVGASVTSDAEVVSLRDDAELGAFVRRLAARCDDPATRAALREGRQRYRLGVSEPVLGGDPVRAVLRVERGAVTERTVKRAAADGARLVLGAKAVLTPLARDSARSLGVPVEREER